MNRAPSLAERQSLAGEYLEKNRQKQYRKNQFMDSAVILMGSLATVACMSAVAVQLAVWIFLA